MAAVMTDFNGAMLLALENIAPSKGLSVSDIIRQTMIERLEDEEDLRDAREALMELEQDSTLYDFEELKDEWDERTKNTVKKIHAIGICAG